jgi:hypothetical protein
MEMKEEQQLELEKLGQREKVKKVKDGFLIDWMPQSAVTLSIYKGGVVLSR